MSTNLSGDKSEQDVAARSSEFSQSSIDGSSIPAWIRLHKLWFFGGFALLLGIIAIVTTQFMNREGLDNQVILSGRIEAPQTHISAIAATKVKSVLVKEGDKVRKGQLVALLDTGVVTAKVGNLSAARAQATQASRQADLHAAALEQQIAAARKKGNGFFTKMFTTKQGRAKEGERLRGQMLQARMMQMQARGAIAKVDSVSSTAASVKSNFNITSPIAGIVETRSVEPGELVAKGQVLLTIVDPNSAYMRGYIPESQIAKIKIGQKGKVYLDSDSKRAMPAHLTAIDSDPSFTPENVYFKDDRVRQVFGVKISLDNPDGSAKPGMSAEAKMDLKELDKQ